MYLSWRQMLYSFFIVSFPEKLLMRNKCNEWGGTMHSFYIFSYCFFSFNKAWVHHGIRVRRLRNPIKVMLANIKHTCMGFTSLYNKYVPLIMNKKERVFSTFYFCLLCLCRHSFLTPPLLTRDFKSEFGIYNYVVSQYH